MATLKSSQMRRAEEMWYSDIPLKHAEGNEKERWYADTRLHYRGLFFRDEVLR